VSFKRTDGRALHEVRPISITLDAYGYAQASILYAQGNTKVLCGVTLQQGVPPFLKGQRTGWLNAEYAMLPGATHQRSQRDGTQAQRNPRSVEISRLIGRCLRPSVNLNAIGERTIVIDCDVLQADGSTRVACITAASMALSLAAKRWVEQGIFSESIVTMQIAAVSVGIIQNEVCADISFEEDSRADVDFNIILNDQGHILELQGTAEKHPLSWDRFDQIKECAQVAIKHIFSHTATKHRQTPSPAPSSINTNKSFPFSLGNRLVKP
jgi:ribonuclease PH